MVLHWVTALKDKVVSLLWLFLDEGGTYFMLPFPSNDTSLKEAKVYVAFEGALNMGMV